MTQAVSGFAQPALPVAVFGLRDVVERLAFGRGALGAPGEPMGGRSAPGIIAFTTARPGTVLSNWHNTAIPPSQTRWMRKYSGGRLSRSPTA